MTNYWVLAILGRRTFLDRDHQCMTEKDDLFLLCKYPKRKMWRHNYFTSIEICRAETESCGVFYQYQRKKQT